MCGVDLKADAHGTSLSKGQGPFEEGRGGGDFEHGMGIKPPIHLQTEDPCHSPKVHRECFFFFFWGGVGKSGAVGSCARTQRLSSVPYLHRGPGQ